ncbi:glycogen synthase GlgA [Bacillus fonticola]|uniref:glycogen synthase GlgA n=1 Tax=Bacillus fonticola TaxID=2728853 RepID=UPI0014735CDC|nr:glycogen synthase GlgA [Bacillus fonticola]
MNTLFVVGECVPFCKTGGLADVAGSLPQALQRQGTSVSVILPKYGDIPQVWQEKMEYVTHWTVNVGWREQHCGLFQLEHDGVTMYFIDNEYYFRRSQLYGFPDDGERFSFFCLAVLEALPKLDTFPDVLHCHDWHTGMVPYLLSEYYGFYPEYGRIRTVFTIHNLRYQGVFPKSILGELLPLGEEHFTSQRLEFHGGINFLKAALVASDRITTVSPSYAKEIQTEEYGERLTGVLQVRTEHISGIVNGIDEEVYNPVTDVFIPHPFTASIQESKSLNKRTLQQQMSLPEQDVPLVAVISRLTNQKGMGLVREVFHELMKEDIQFVLLGSGERDDENFFREMEAQYHEKCRSYIGFDESFAHHLYAASDMLLLPSLFEPCGLSQLIGMKYGTVPIVRETGGLKDTVLSYNEETGEGWGFTFGPIDSSAFLYTVRRALSFYENGEVWQLIQQRCLQRDVSWDSSALAYNELYEEITTRRESHVF